MSADIGAEVCLAQTEADRNAVFAVRYQVFVDEQIEHISMRKQLPVI